MPILMFGGSLMRGSREMLVAAPALAAVGDDKPFAWLSEIVQLLARFVVIDDGADGNWNIHGSSVAARALAAFAVTAALGLMLGIKTEMQQRVVVFAGDKNHIAAAPAVPAAGASAWNEFLAAKRQTAIAAVARLHADSYFINKHGFGPFRARRLRSERLLGGFDADELAEAATIAKCHDARDLRKQRVILAA